ncbi:MAG TPA: HAMP domain-containing sensor histidine kinase [Ktedonobacteraceae bacterium]|nr:HAMP domain-containing sensor histidine kinase [Ktedonobacteraceae bacterium]
MSEPRIIAAKEQLDSAPFPTQGSEAALGSVDGGTAASSGHSATTAQQHYPSDNEDHKAPSWLRPFFGLRAQLTFAYSLLLALVVLVAAMALYMQPSHSYASVVAIALFAVGSLLAFIFTTMLLRPLDQVINAAQALAVGDLEQRGRLHAYLRLPPQDDVDRLAGSLNEMVKRLEKAGDLQRASERRFQQFFSDASHQLRTPLTSIRGFTGILMRGAIDDATTRQHVLSRMKNETERMTALINDLLTLSRLDGGYPLKLQYVDLVELATKAVEQAQTRANDERKISLLLKVESGLGAHVDGERIQQVLFILLDNALKYGRPAPDGEIGVQLARHDGHAVIIVSDNGEGIAQEDREHIFQSFYRGRQRKASTQQDFAAGFGLGLAIAYSIVMAHKGKITFASSPSTGTQFSVILPGVE